MKYKTRNKRRNKKEKNYNRIFQILCVIYLIAIVMFVITLLLLDMLPIKYLVPVIVILYIISIWIIWNLFLFHPKKKKRRITAVVCSIFMMLLYFFGFLYMKGTLDFLNNITMTTQTHAYHVLTTKNSEYNALKDISGQTVNVTNHADKEYIEAKRLLKEKVDVSFKENTDALDLCSALIEGTTDLIFISSAYYDIALEEIEGFNEETIYILDTIAIEREVDKINKNVNVTQKPFHVFISGLDTTGPVSTVSRSDVNMIVTVNPTTKQILLTSIPRDYYVTLANKGQKDKLTHAGLGGVENSVKTLENFLGIDINYYVKVNFTSLVKIVDAIGGIDVESPVAFTTTHGGYHIKAGMNHMNGDMTLAFVRERHGLNGGDNDRITNQQRVFKAILEKVMSPAIVTNYSSILNSVSDTFETNMPSSDMTDLIKMQINDMASWDIQQIQLSGTGKMMTGGAYMPNQNLYYMIPDESSVETCVALMRQIEAGEIIHISN